MSARKVRTFIQSGCFDKIEDFVPLSTYQYLKEIHGIDKDALLL